MVKNALIKVYDWRGVTRSIIVKSTALADRATKFVATVVQGKNETHEMCKQAIFTTSANFFRSCGDISFDPSCRKDCVEGCNCPEGQTLDDRNECIPIGQCPCQHAGLVFKAGYREVRPGTKSQELCTCASGVWNCQPATLDEIDDYPAAADLKSVCSAAGNQELSTCLPVEPKTCRNMLTAVTQSPAICKPGCVCKKNYVLDVPSGKCVKEDECPCYHGGKSYKEGSSMQEECNTCKCNNGKWNCTDRICDGNKPLATNVHITSKYLLY